MGLKYRIRMITVVVNIISMIIGMVIFSLNYDPLKNLTPKEKIERAARLPVEKNKYDDVTKFMNKYINAQFSNDKKALEDCLYDMKDYDEEAVKKRYSIYKSIDKIDVYTIDGYYADSYIVYTLTEERLKDVDVSVPILYCYYVSTVMGRLCVSRTDVKTEVKAYMTNTWNNPGVIELKDEVNERCEKLKTENAEYAEFIKTRNLDGTTKTPPTTEPPQPQSTDPNDAFG